MSELKERSGVVLALSLKCVTLAGLQAVKEAWKLCRLDKWTNSF